MSHEVVKTLAAASPQFAEIIVCYEVRVAVQEVPYVFPVVRGQLEGAALGVKVKKSLIVQRSPEQDQFSGAMRTVPQLRAEKIGAEKNISLVQT